IRGNVEWTTNSSQRHSKIMIQLMPSAKDNSSTAKWKDLGLSNELIEIDRDLVKTPIPLKGEPGYSSEVVSKRRAQINKPKQANRLAPTHKYSFALSVEQTENNDWLTRYLGGECEAVWNELLELGEGIREPLLLGKAIAVVRETMRRCRYNIEQIVS